MLSKRATLARRIIFAIILLFFSLLASLADAQGIGEANHLFYRANSAYKEGNFEAAIGDYKGILDLGLESGNLYYNLGNSYFKKDDPGEAVYYYEKALTLMPGDSDLRSNYEYALSSLGAARAYFGNRFQRFCARLFDGVTADLLAVFLFVLYALVVVMFILKLYTRAAKNPALQGGEWTIEPLKYSASTGLKSGVLHFSRAGIVVKTAAPLVAAVMIISATAFHSKITFLNKGAIVVRGPAEVKFEPLESATTFFKLGSGNRVEVLDRTADWLKIRRPDGKIGWVEGSRISRITAS